MPEKVLEKKLAKTEYDIHELIKKRWSPRSFSDKPVKGELIRQLFDAARWAPSSYNEQPWRFIVAAKEHPEEYERISKVLNDFNASWAKTAPVLIIGLKKDTFEKDGRTNIHAGHDLGHAVANLTIEAARHDLYVHQMAGILPDKAQNLYNIPANYTPLRMIALGYLGDAGLLPENLETMERSERNRMPIDELVFRSKWNNPKKI